MVVEKWAAFFLLAQLALLIGGDVVPLNDDVELLELSSVDDAIKEQVSELETQERNSLVASQAASRARNEADRSYRTSLRNGERVMDAKHRLQAAQGTHVRARQERRDAKADLQRAENEQTHQETVQKQLNNDIESQTDEANKALQKAEDQVSVAMKRVTRFKAEKQQSEDKAREETASATRAAAAAVAALSDLQQQARSAATASLDASVVRTGKKVALEQQGFRSGTLGGAKNAAELEKAKAREASLATERVQEKMEEANSAAQSATSAGLAEKGREATSVAEAENQKELTDETVESESAKLETYEADVSELKSKEYAGADQLKSQKAIVEQMEEVMAEKQSAYMKDQLSLGQETMMASTKDTPELKMARNAVEQAKKAVKEARRTEQEAHRAVKTTKEEVSKSQLALSDSKDGQVAAAMAFKDQIATGAAEVAKEELHVKAARKDAHNHGEKIKEEQARKVADDHAAEEALAVEATEKSKRLAQLEGELGASHADEEAEKERLRAIKHQVHAEHMKAEQEHARQRQLEEKRVAAREAALAAEKRSSDKAADELQSKAARDSRDLKRGSEHAQEEAEENAKKLQGKFEDAQKQSKADAAGEVQKSEAKAKMEKKASDDKTAHMLAQAQSSPSTPCNSTDMDASDMAQEALEASQQEANAMMAVESAALGKQVAQQVEAEVSGAKGEAKGMLRDNRAMALKERKTAREEAKREETRAKQKAEDEKLLISEAKEAGNRIQQAARADAAAVKAEINAGTSSARKAAKSDLLAEEKEEELRINEEEEKLRRSHAAYAAIAANAKSAAHSQERAEAEKKKMEAEIRELRESSLQQLHRQQQRDASMIGVQQKALEKTENELKAQRKKAISDDAAGDNKQVTRAQLLLAQSEEALAFARNSVKHAEQVKEGAKEDLVKLEDKLEDVKAVRELQRRSSREKLGEIARVHSISEAAFNKAKGNYQTEEAKYHSIRAEWRQAKSSLDKKSAQLTRAKLVLEQYQRQAEQRDSDVRRAIGEQSTNDDRVKLAEAEAKQKAKYESEQFSEAEQEMRAEQRNADAQEQKLQSDKQQAAKSSIRDSAKAKSELAEMDRQESAAERKKTELELQEQRLVSNVESTKGAVLELAVKHKSDSVQKEHAVQQAKEEQLEWAAKKQITQNKLQRLQAQLEMRKANQDNLVESANAHRRLAAQELAASLTREEEAAKAADEAQEGVNQLEKELAETNMSTKKFESKSKQLEIVADTRAKTRDAAAAELDNLRSAQEQQDQQRAKKRIQTSRGDAHSARKQADKAIDHAKDARLVSEKEISKYELEVKDREAELKVEKMDKLAASRLTVRKAQSEAEKVITRAAGTANRAKLRADAADEKLQMVSADSQKQSKLEKDMSYEAVRQAKLRTADAEALIKKRKREFKRESGNAKRTASKRDDLLAQRKTAEASQAVVEKKVHSLSLKKEKIETESMQELSEVKKSHHAVTVRAQGFERQLDVIKESAGSAQLNADKQARILESEKDRLRDETRVSNDEITNAQREAKFSVTKSQADLESTQREVEDQSNDVTSELNSQLTTLKSKLNQQVTRAKQEAEMQLDHKKEAFQLEVDQAKRSEKDATDRRKKFEDQLQEHKDALKTANEKIATMKAEAESLRNSLFTKIDKDENGSLDREEFASPLDSGFKESSEMA